MDVGLILRVAGVGMLVSVCVQILGKTGREDYGTLVSVAGIVLVLLLLVGQIGDLLASVREVFGL